MNKKLCIVVTPSFVLHSLYRYQMKYLKNNGFEVVAIASRGHEHKWLEEQGVKTYQISMAREPHLLKDVVSLFRLIAHFITHRYDIVHVSTPKASLLGSIAAKITFHGNIIYTIRGRVYENYSGFKATIFETLEWIICSLANQVISISKEMRDDLVLKKICKRSKVSVIGSGSGNGVDLNIFTPSETLEKKALLLKRKLGIPENDLIILSVGRIRHEKGIDELVRVFMKLFKNKNNIHLVLQGKFEEADPLDRDVFKEIKTNKYIHHIPWNKEVSVVYSLADILAFPSHREGFGNVAIEASAMMLPVISYNVVGCRESVNDKVSGVLVQKENEHELYVALELFIDDEELRKKFGEQGREWVERNFKSEVVWDGLISFYNDSLCRK